tara:strand:- start:179 stop:481 length:303 start_codon:yes stop_codon:yes gene_type:complete
MDGYCKGVSWQSREDREDRVNMIHQIVALLQRAKRASKKPDAPDDWFNKLPDLARRMEDTLYRSAKSKEQYVDVNSLKQRLQEVANTYVCAYVLLGFSKE